MILATTEETIPSGHSGTARLMAIGWDADGQYACRPLPGTLEACNALGVAIEPNRRVIIQKMRDDGRTVNVITAAES